MTFGEIENNDYDDVHIGDLMFVQIGEVVGEKQNNDQKEANK